MEGVDKSALEALIQKNVGARIRKLRKAQNLNAVALASKAGISQGQLSKIENGKATISIKNLAGICRILGHPLSALFQGDEMEKTGGHTITAVAGLEYQGLHWLEREISRYTENAVLLRTLGTIQFGPVGEQIELLFNREIDLFIEELVHFSRIAPDLRHFNLPYCFDSEAKRVAFLQSEYFKKNVADVLLENGIRCLNPPWNWTRGVERAIIANRPIVSPEDVKGLRVRIYKSEIQKLFWQHMGAIPVVVPYSEIRQAIDTEKVDAVPLDKELLYRPRLCRNARFVTILGDLDSIMGVFITEEKFRSFPHEIRNSLIKACGNAGEIFSQNVKLGEEKNEKLNMSRCGAVYLKVNLEPWRIETMRIRRRLMADNALSAAAWDAMEQAR